VSVAQFAVFLMVVFMLEAVIGVVAYLYEASVCQAFTFFTLLNSLDI